MSSLSCLTIWWCVCGWNVMVWNSFFRGFFTRQGKANLRLYVATVPRPSLEPVQNMLNPSGAMPCHLSLASCMCMARVRVHPGLRWGFSLFLLLSVAVALSGIAPFAGHWMWIPSLTFLFVFAVCHRFRPARSWWMPSPCKTLLPVSQPHLTSTSKASWRFRILSLFNLTLCAGARFYYPHNLASHRYSV